MALRIVFAGTPDFAAAHLQALIDSEHQLVAVYSQPDRPAGRGKKLQPSPVKHVALEHDIPVYQPLNFKEDADRQTLAELKADIMVVVAYGLLLPQSVLDIPRLGCINVHGSLLPRWRGAAPIQRAIEAGDKESGVCIMQMEAGLDTGPMLLKAHCAIEDSETGGSLHDKLIPLGQQALLQTLSLIESGAAQAELQDDSLSTYAKKFTKEEMAVDWSQSAQQIHNKIRAFNPFPVATTLSAGDKIRLWGAQLSPLNTVSPDAIPGTMPGTIPNTIPGTIIQADAEGLRISCGHQSILLTDIQIPGKKSMPVSEILKSRAERFAVGQTLGH